jgi:hypothetical protein
MVRLNLLPLLLAYTMNTDYISYYFSPLVSMWFLIIYGTMAIGSEYNERIVFLVSKLLLSASIVTWCMKEPWILETLFELLRRFCGIHWSAREWAFRVNLDLWIVYIGMLAALAVIKIKEYRIHDHPCWPLAVRIAIGVSCLTVVWFFGFELYQESKFTYNPWHPYVSFLPVLAFVTLRNASVRLRSASSQAFALVGRCSLETFIIQYHFWLAGDTKGVLLVIPGTHWRPINFVITTVMFIYVSDQMARATTSLTTSICGGAPKTLPISAPSNPIPLPASRVEQGALRNEGREVSMPLVSTNTDHSRKDNEGPLPPEPDTPIRARRWMDRLAEGPSVPPRTSVLHGWYPVNSWNIGLRTRLSVGVAVMWLANLMWSH